MTTIADARAQLVEQAPSSLPEAELRQFIAIGAAMRAARSTEELVATLLRHASAGPEAECLAAVVETTLGAHARGERVMLTIVDAKSGEKLREKLAQLDLLDQSKLY
jgi:hypothetical protein